MISLTEIKNRLNDEMVEPFDVLSLAANYDTVIANGIQGEVNIYVISGGDAGSISEGTGLIVSEVGASISILIGVREVTDALGDAAADPLKTYREDVAQALQGFRPTDAGGALAFSNGAPVDFTDGVYWQLDTYLTSYNLRG